MIEKVFKALADTFCTFKAVFKRVVCTWVALCLCFGSISAIKPEEIQEQIKYALEIVRQTELRLKELNPELTNIWITERTNEEGHRAEVELRNLYPREYMAYLAAKSNLDDLLYTQYLIFVNGKAE